MEHQPARAAGRVQKCQVVGNRFTSPIFVFFEPISTFMLISHRRAEAFLLWLPWPVLVGFAFLLGSRFGGAAAGHWRRGSLRLSGALLGRQHADLWRSWMPRAMSLLIGIPLGVWMARSDRRNLARLILDGMQPCRPLSSFPWHGFFAGRCRRPSQPSSGAAWWSH